MSAVPEQQADLTTHHIEGMAAHVQAIEACASEDSMIPRVMRDFYNAWRARRRAKYERQHEVRAVLAELLRLYDLRRVLAGHEENGTMPPKDLKKALVRYGREKKIAWDRAREVLR